MNELYITSSDIEESTRKQTLKRPLFFCPVLSRARLGYVGTLLFRGLEEVPKMDIKTILLFLNSFDEHRV